MGKLIHIGQSRIIPNQEKNQNKNYREFVISQFPDINFDYILFSNKRFLDSYTRIDNAAYPEVKLLKLSDIIEVIKLKLDEKQIKSILRTDKYNGPAKDYLIKKLIKITPYPEVYKLGSQPVVVNDQLQKQRLEVQEYSKAVCQQQQKKIKILQINFGVPLQTDLPTSRLGPVNQNYYQPQLNQARTELPKMENNQMYQSVTIIEDPINCLFCNELIEDERIDLLCTDKQKHSYHKKCLILSLEAQVIQKQSEKLQCLCGIKVDSKLFFDLDEAYAKKVKFIKQMLHERQLQRLARENPDVIKKCQNDDCPYIYRYSKDGTNTEYHYCPFCLDQVKSGEQGQVCN